MLYYIFILHQTTTAIDKLNDDAQLYYIFILHQTTTIYVEVNVQKGCIISSFYIKPQQPHAHQRGLHRCIISSFYIKPQRTMGYKLAGYVVLYLHSTSNHN